MLKKKEKEKIISEHKTHDKDTGSADVQIAMLSKNIDHTLSHLKKHPKDLHTRRGLLKIVIKRKRLLKYLQKKNPKKYEVIIKKLGLKK